MPDDARHDPQADFVTIPDHARWKYLLSADGFTASCRLGKLLGTDSCVLKARLGPTRAGATAAKPEQRCRRVSEGAARCLL